MSGNIAGVGANLHVFCDFDNTITTGETVDILLEALADPAWLDIEAQWERGKLSTGECMRRQVPLIRGGWNAVTEVLKTIKVDHSFGPFVQWCRQRQIPVSIVSDGLDRVIQHLLQRERISVGRIWANTLVEDDAGNLSLDFPARGKRIVCATGRCKCQVLDQERSNVTKIVIGDGRSDFCWAHNADVLFAKEKLLKYAREHHLPVSSFDSFLQVRMQLEEMVSRQVPQAAGMQATFGDVPVLVQG